MWAFLRNFSANKFFEAAKGGGLDGVAPFTFGAVFALSEETLVGESIFGDFDLGVDGFGLSTGSLSRLIAADGTLLLFSGSGQNVDGTAVPDSDPSGGTYEVNDADLVNRFKAYLDPNSAPGGAGGTTAARAWPSPRTQQLVYVALSNNGVTSFAYCNGKVVGLSATGAVANADPVRIGLNNAGAAPASTIQLAGCFYKTVDVDPDYLDRHFLACKQTQDIPSRTLYGDGDLELNFVWSVKRSRLWDGRDNWASDGASASINMVRQGATPGVFNGLASDVIAADLGWMTV